MIWLIVKTPKGPFVAIIGLVLGTSIILAWVVLTSLILVTNNDRLKDKIYSQLNCDSLKISVEKRIYEIFLDSKNCKIFLKFFFQ